MKKANLFKALINHNLKPTHNITYYSTIKLLYALVKELQTVLYVVNGTRGGVEISI